MYDDDLYFNASGDGQGRELWRYDGATGTVELAAEIEPGRGPEATRASSLSTTGDCIFSADTDAEGRELWSYDAASGATAMIDVRPGGDSASPGLPIVYAGALYFAATSPDVRRRTDGVQRHNRRSVAAEIRPGAGGGASGEPMAVLGDVLYFQGNDSVTGGELWSYTASGGATLAADIHVGTPQANSFPTALTRLRRPTVFQRQQRHKRARAVVVRRRPHARLRHSVWCSSGSNPGSFVALQRRALLEGQRRRERQTSCGAWAPRLRTLATHPAPAPEALELTGANPFQGATSVRVRVSLSASPSRSPCSTRSGGVCGRSTTAL